MFSERSSLLSAARDSRAHLPKCTNGLPASHLLQQVKAAKQLVGKASRSRKVQLSARSRGPVDPKPKIAAESVMMNGCQSAMLPTSTIRLAGRPGIDPGLGVTTITFSSRIAAGRVHRTVGPTPVGTAT